MIKPDPAKAFEQIKKLLTENVTLSNQRAAAVMKELITQHKVDAKRLKSYGVGP